MGQEEPVIHPVPWELAPVAAQNQWSRAWLTFQSNRCLARNSLAAYTRGLELYLGFLAERAVPIETATRAEIGAYVQHLLTPRPGRVANATLQQRLTVVRLFYAFLVEEGVCTRNPAQSHAPGARSLVPRHRRLPWIPNEEEWKALLEAARQEPVRNRFMFALSYDAALRREELCSLSTSDIDPAHRLIHLGADRTKFNRERVVPYSAATGVLYGQFLRDRRQISRDRGPLFLSESRRNRGSPISIWTWSKVIEQIADRAGVQPFTTHTLRHLCLTDLARDNWDIQEIALFAGHRNIQTTLLYIHLSGRDLAAKLARSMADLHARRVKLIGDLLS